MCVCGRSDHKHCGFHGSPAGVRSHTRGLRSAVLKNGSTEGKQGSGGFSVDVTTAHHTTGNNKDGRCGSKSTVDRGLKVDHKGSAGRSVIKSNKIYTKYIYIIL